MRILINASNLIVGGGVIVTKGVINSILAIPSTDEFTIIIPQSSEYSGYQNIRNVKFIKISKFISFTLLGKLISPFFIQRIIKKHTPDRIFSMGNFAFKSHVPQLLFIQNAYPFYPKSQIWKELSLVQWITQKAQITKFRFRLKYASAITVQTEVIKNRLIEQFNPQVQISVIDSCYKFNKSESLTPKINIFDTAYRYFFTPAFYSKHKNLDLLIEVARLIKSERLKYKIIFTLEHKGYGAALENKINSYHLNDVILNVGSIPHHEISFYYNNSSALLFPSLLETFGLPYIEALQHELPIITSDLDFARQTCGDNAIYVNPLSAQSILDGMKQIESFVFIKKNDTKYREWKEITNEYIQVLKSL